MDIPSSSGSILLVCSCVYLEDCDHEARVVLSVLYKFQVISEVYSKYKPHANAVFAVAIVLMEAREEVEADVGH